MRRGLWLSFVLAGASLFGAGSGPPVAIRNARVVTVSGPVLTRGTVLIRDGLIAAVGENVTVPPEAWVYEAEGLTVYPGLIDALSGWGIPAPPTLPRPAASSASSTPPAQGPEDRPSNNSFVKAADIADTADKRIEGARNAGFTSAVVFPQSGIFAGQGTVINLAGETVRQMVVHPTAGQLLTLSRSGFATGFPNSLMGMIAYIRQTALDADQYRSAREAYDRSPRGATRPDYDRTLDGWLASPRVLLPATTAVEIDRMLRLAADLKTKTVLYGVHGGYAAVEMLAKSGTPALVSLKWPERNPAADPDAEEPVRVLELREKAPTTPAAFVKAGVKFAFYSDRTDNPGTLMKSVRRAIIAGLAQEDAVRAMTLSAAEIYGVDDRLGSIEPGKIANLVVTRGELFQENTQVKYVFIDGRKFEPLPAAEEAPR